MLTIEQIKANIEEMNRCGMHEVDQLVMMVDTQRSLIRLLQARIKELEVFEP